MDTARWTRARAIFGAVVDLAPEARAAGIAAACGDDLGLRREVESLLAHDRASDDSLERLVGAAAQDAAQDAADEHADLASGQALLHYGLTARIGHGGMGVVWRATDFTLGRDVAIKVLPAEFARDAGRRARFEREGKLLAALSHANIAAVYSLHEHAGRHFLAMEYVEGADLSSRLARGALPLAVVLPIARQIADALEEAHERGIVHRDLKPANVKVTRDGKVKVLDFGLGKAIADDTAVGGSSDASGSSEVAGGTQAGRILGTAAYMPPEQARGLAVDKRADIWAFGVMLFEMLSGRRPFAGATLTDVLAAVVSAEPDWSLLPAGTPAALVHLITRCLQKDVRQRTRDMGDVRIEIEQLIAAAAGSGDARPAMLSPAAAPGRVRWRDVAMLVAGGAAAAGLVLTLTERTAPADAAVQRFNVALPPGIALLDVVDGGRQSLSTSRDGGTIAFAAIGPGGRRQIYRRRLDRVSVEPVAGTEGGDMPFLSPDGAWIGFVAEGRLHKVPIEGGQATVLCEAPEPRGASWTDRGFIVFSAGARGGLSRVPESGGEATSVTTVTAGNDEESHRWPVILPGGRAALFNVESATDNATRAIEVVDLETGARRTLVRGGTDARYVDGYLVYGSAGTLLAAPFDLSRLELTGPARPVLDDVRMDVRATGKVFFDLTAAGALAYVPGYPRPGERSLIWLDRRGRATPVTGETRAFRGARLSPDGRRLAVTIQDSSNSLWLFDLGRGSWYRFMVDGAVDTPAWAPDGRSVLYSSNPHGSPAIFRVPIDGGPPEEVSPRSPLLMDMPAVAPDGRVVFVATQDARGDDIRVLSLDSRRTLQPFVATAASEISPEVSPSGRFVAYSSNESGRREVYVRRYPADGRRWIVSSGGGSTPRWRRDERELFYLEGARLMAVSVGPRPSLTIGTPQVLFEEPALAWSNADLIRYDVTADGQRFVTVRPEARELAALQVVVVPRFGDEMRARLGHTPRTRR